MAHGSGPIIRVMAGLCAFCKRDVDSTVVGEKLSLGKLLVHEYCLVRIDWIKIMSVQLTSLLLS